MEINYSQPDFYRFNEDSIILAKLAAEQSLQSASIRCLDLAAGCGVVGLETCVRRKDIAHLTLVEMQPEFLPHLKINCSQWEGDYSIIQSRIGEYHPASTFDLIVGNLPYFAPGEGRESPDPRRQACRHFTVDGPEIVLKKISQLLAANGVALLLMHQRQWEHCQTQLKTQILWQRKEILLIHFCK